MTEQVSIRAKVELGDPQESGVNNGVWLIFEKYRFYIPGLTPEIAEEIEQRINCCRTMGELFEEEQDKLEKALIKISELQQSLALSQKTIKELQESMICPKDCEHYVHGKDSCMSHVPCKRHCDDLYINQSKPSVH